MAQGRSTEVMSMIEWIWIRRLSIKKSLSTSPAHETTPNIDVLPQTTLKRQTSCVSRGTSRKTDRMRAHPPSTPLGPSDRKDRAQSASSESMAIAHAGQHRGTAHKKTYPHRNLQTANASRALWWSKGGWAVYDERGTPVWPSLPRASTRCANVIARLSAGRREGPGGDSI